MCLWWVFIISPPEFDVGGIFLSIICEFNLMGSSFEPYGALRPLFVTVWKHAL
jgi:hypothetical protein